MENLKPENPFVNPTQENTLTGYGGMTLRDHFAGLAMQSMVSSKELRELFADKGNLSNTDWMDVLAENAHCIADAMLKQRES